MGGYAAFVWPSFAVSAIVMIGLLVAARRSLARNRAVLAALEAARGTPGSAPMRVAAREEQEEAE